ncbi:hypothetical protein [Haloferax sulfurifontis]|uniref:Uncharacterized protein n=2 Tax=Haloferax sulfurifontis TaxID=255616 RepID=M0HXY4_9EURY|nr:hypothetical protein [Haloferax sulfurifontis]ELZ88547.1 hypothetical protein C441_17572 [Haloferax sulfurifontis ATCC BAA-897]GGC67444.1 hypothetical protein GCM10007209_31960 [Haloferax sulfurifontis]
MPKENRFAGLGEAMESESESDDEEIPDETASDAPETSDAEPVVESETADESESEGASEESDGGDEKQGDGESDEGEEPDESDELGESEKLDEAKEAAESDTGEESAVADETKQATKAEGGPAFEFEATTAKSIYVRTATLDRLDDAEFEVESLLRREHDVRDLTGREFHDALVRVAAEYPEEIADAVLETRDE